MASTKFIWTESDIKLFTACKDMFYRSSITDKFERNSTKEGWEKLMTCIKELAQPTLKCQEQENLTFNSDNSGSGLKQIIAWPGGKNNELKFILPNVPSYHRFFEPFVGGGSVFMGINAREFFINDFSTDLISVYNYISSSNPQFLNYLEMIDMSMKRAGEFFISKKEELTELYSQYFCEQLDDNEIIQAINDWCECNQYDIIDILGEFQKYPCDLVKEMREYLLRRFRNMKIKSTTDQKFINIHLEVAIKGALYVCFRTLYNNRTITESNQPLHNALFIYIRQNVLSSMFSFNKKGEFCGSYGCGSQLKNSLIGKINYFKSEKVQEHFNKTHLFNLDFEEFLLKSKPTETDFIFLDPPYDCTFSKYDNNEFNREDHKRLANYLLNNCKAKWMMIINKTDYILNLYDSDGIYIKEYDKKYNYNVKNNNKRETKHLMITNYPLKENMEMPILAA